MAQRSFQVEDFKPIKENRFRNTGWSPGLGNDQFFVGVPDHFILKNHFSAKARELTHLVMKYRKVVTRI